MMSLNEAVKRRSFSLSFRRLRQQIIVSRHENSPQFAGPVQQCCIIQLASAIFIGGEDIYAAQPKPKSNRSWNMLIHVEGKRHQLDRFAFKRPASGVAFVFCCIWSTD